MLRRQDQALGVYISVMACAEPGDVTWNRIIVVVSVRFSLPTKDAWLTLNFPALQAVGDVLAGLPFQRISTAAGVARPGAFPGLRLSIEAEFFSVSDWISRDD